ncbi:hypothetical protein NZD89_14625 [Alicyclobacillus fastidiosus]|uniref:Uncharacterized protein n=1 Tax=Alicyclobacillus fastidiosus TaxID=392011 RepID=A0ABY6Z9U5_9BACL|nr:hypothetical protein [Alicyclobacillus fastidiosus]WAH39653.1 hypothetical protein NZD89_14625 [Alicyclobacillus fastidiosus]
MGDSKTFNYPKAHRRSTSSQSGNSSLVDKPRKALNQPTSFQKGGNGQ